MPVQPKSHLAGYLPEGLSDTHVYGLLRTDAGKDALRKDLCTQCVSFSAMVKRALAASGINEGRRVHVEVGTLEKDLALVLKWAPHVLANGESWRIRAGPQHSFLEEFKVLVGDVCTMLPQGDSLLKMLAFLTEGEQAIINYAKDHERRETQRMWNKARASVAASHVDTPYQSGPYVSQSSALLGGEWKSGCGAATAANAWVLSALLADESMLPAERDGDGSGWRRSRQIEHYMHGQLLAITALKFAVDCKMLSSQWWGLRSAVDLSVIVQIAMPDVAVEVIPWRTVAARKYSPKQGDMIFVQSVHLLEAQGLTCPMDEEKDNDRVDGPHIVLVANVERTFITCINPDTSMHSEVGKKQRVGVPARLSTLLCHGVGAGLCVPNECECFADEQWGRMTIALREPRAGTQAHQKTRGYHLHSVLTPGFGVVRTVEKQ